MSWIREIFCGHDWRPHDKQKREWVESVIIEGTENWWQPLVEKRKFCTIKETLICKKCGQAKQIKL